MLASLGSGVYLGALEFDRERGNPRFSISLHARKCKNNFNQLLLWEGRKNIRKKRKHGGAYAWEMVYIERKVYKYI